MPKETYQDLQFRCEVCRTEFPADPDTMLEFRVSLEHPGRPFTPEELEAFDELHLSAFGLDDDSRQKLLEGEMVTVGGCMCKACQERFAQ